MRNGSEVHDRVLAVLQENAATLLKVARRHSLCDDDAHDAYQRSLEIYLERVDQVDAVTAGPWLRTVVKHEAMRLRESRLRTLGSEAVDLDALESASSVEDRALSFERVASAAEALQHCKRDEVAAMVLKADGHSYAEIASVTGFSYTKVNRCLTEGRARFLKRFADIESGEECTRLAPLLSLIVDGEATPVQMADARPHLRNCTACRASLRELAESQAAIHAAFPGAILLGGASFSWLDRLMLPVVKAQQAIEALSGAKVAAVAASAAAVAGGGAVAVEPLASKVDTPPERPAVSAAVDPTATPGPAPRRVQARMVARPARKVVKPAPAATPAPVRRRREFSFETSGPPVTAKPAAAAKKKTESFGFER